MLNEATFEVFGTVRKIEQNSNGRKWLRLTVTVDRSYTDGNNQRVEKTTWFEAVCFNPKLIEIINKLDVHDRYIRLKWGIEIGSREFEGRQIKETSFVLDDLKLLDRKPRD